MIAKMFLRGWEPQNSSASQKRLREAEKTRQGMYDNADLSECGKRKGKTSTLCYGSDESFFPFLSNGVRSLSPRARLVFREPGRDPFGTGVLTPLKMRRSGIPPPRTRTLSNPHVT